MQKSISSIALTGLLLAVLIPAHVFAQDRDRDHDWERAHRVVEHAQEDLRHIEHHDVWAVAERGHYDAAERNLSDVRHDLDANRLDRRRLDAAIGEIEHVANVGALDRRAHELLNGDVRELHRLRDDWHWR